MTNPKTFKSQERVIFLKALACSERQIAKYDSLVIIQHPHGWVPSFYNSITRVAGPGRPCNTLELAEEAVKKLEDTYNAKLERVKTWNLEEGVDLCREVLDLL